MKNIILNLAIILIAQLIWIRCASVATPTGGKKDEIPPSVEKTVPLNLSKNYKGQLVEMVFSEPILVENLKQELLITPGIEGTYEYEIKKNRISLNFEKPFQSNTTYTLNFRNSIKDITEKNVANDAKIVFSTGDVIDSLLIKGNVKDLLTNKAEADVLVMLYKTSDTLDIKNSVPYYFTKTDKQGNYLLENLRKDEYNIYALLEKNNNLKYDNPNEKIAFLQEPIILDSNINSINFKIVRIDKIPPRIVRSSSDLEYFNLEFNEGIIQAVIKPTSNVEDLPHQIRQNKNIRIYNTFNKFDSIPLLISVTDSSGNKMDKEIKIKFNEVKKQTREKFTIDTTPKEGEKINANLTYRLEFNKPVVRYNLKQIVFLADTLTPIELDTEKDMKWNNFRTELSVSKKINIRKNIRIEIPEGTFFSVEGDTSNLIKTTHELKDASDYGMISGTVNTDEPNIIIQLINAEYKVVAEQINAKNFKFEYLQAGKYMVRVIVDKNGNGLWDNGDLEKRILPEMIIFMENELDLKQNWDLTGNEITL